MAAAAETVKADPCEEVPATQASPEGTAEQQQQQLVTEESGPEAPAPAVVPAAPLQCVCRFCKAEFKCSECHEFPGITNPHRRWGCKPCYNSQVTLKRHGICAEELCNGEGLAKFFSELRREREELQKDDNRLSYGRMRAQLKQHIIRERIEIFEASTEGEYQPLSYWELKGYDVEKIEAMAPCKDHEVLGATYRVAIDKDKHAAIVQETEQKIVAMENSIHQKKKKELEPESAAKALQDLGFRPGVPVDVDSDPGLSEEAETEVAGDKPKNNKKRKTEEEKEEARQDKKRAKRAEKQDRVELAAAAKVLPSLKAVEEKLQKTWKKVTPELLPRMQEETKAAVEDVLKDIKDIMDQAQTRLQAAAKGKSAPAADFSLWTSEKDLNQKVREANKAVRAVQCFLKEQQPQRPAQPKAGAKGKAKAKASR